MPKRDYKRLDIYGFGQHLLTTGDIDPVYILLKNSNLQQEQIKRWLVAYWCLYHCGVASWLSEFEGPEFWHHLRTAAINETPTPLGGRWPRGSERRHWRGKQALASLEAMAKTFPDRPERMVEYIAGTGGDFVDLAKRVQEQRGFGPWIAFKAGDMVERVLGIPVNFDQASVFMFKDPVKAAIMLWRKQMGLPEEAKPKDQQRVIDSVVTHLTGHFADYQAPPGGRKIGLQEVETILCKWKSHMNGHYPLLNDTHEILEGLEEWSSCSDTAGQLLEVSVDGWMAHAV